MGVLDGRRFGRVFGAGGGEGDSLWHRTQGKTEVITFFSSAVFRQDVFSACHEKKLSRQSKAADISGLARRHKYGIFHSPSLLLTICEPGLLLNHSAEKSQNRPEIFPYSKRQRG